MIVLSETERMTLERLVRRRSAEARVVMRARIILLVDRGMRYRAVAEKMNIDKKSVTTWVARWNGTAPSEGQQAPPAEVRLADLPRTGAPPRITAEQKCSLIALACRKPEEFGRPITHWSNRELADEALKQEVVEQISPRHAGRILKKTTFDLTRSGTGSIPVPIQIGKSASKMSARSTKQQANNFA